MLMLDRDEHAQPLYLQVARSLDDQIVRGVYKVGDKLPSEPYLADHLAVSRATIVRAFDELKRNGTVVRRQGKGTFVADRPLQHGLNEVISFTDFTRRTGAQPSQRLLDYRVCGPDEPRDDLLGTFSADTNLVVLRRLRLSDGAPVGLHQIALPRALLEQVGLTREELEKEQVSIYRHLAHHGLQPVTADEWLRAVPAPHDVATPLDVPTGSALMRVRRVSRNRDGATVEAVDAYYPGSLYEYHAVLSAQSTAPGKKESHESQGNSRIGSGVRVLSP